MLPLHHRATGWAHAAPTIAGVMPFDNSPDFLASAGFCGADFSMEANGQSRGDGSVLRTRAQCTSFSSHLGEGFRFMRERPLMVI